MKIRNYNYVREFRKQSDDFPANMSYKDIKGGSPQEIADLFKIFFESVYSKPSSDSVKNFIENSQHKEKIRNICHQLYHQSTSVVKKFNRKLIVCQTIW